MLIRRPITEVFEAFVEPQITTQFWFSRSDGRLEQGADTRWYWDKFGVSAPVRVLELEANNRILIEWGEGQGQNVVEWIFEERQDGTTLVKIVNHGFKGSDDEIVTQAIDAKGGFTLVLANAKAFLEHNLQLNLINDHFPDV
ncbi:MAG: SRPBCC family protein [Chloroflexota bacterium]